MSPIEIFDDDQEQAAHVAETEQEKPKPARRSRKASRETPAEAAPEAKAPKKRSRPSKKSQPADAETAQPAAAADLELKEIAST